MSAFRDSSAVLRVMQGGKFRDSGSTLRTLQGAWMRDAGSILRAVFTSMTASINSPTRSGVQGSFGPGALTITSSTAIVTPSGGTAPYSYDWDLTSGDSGIVPTAATSSTTAFSKSCALGEETYATFRCTVTDANGATATADVSVTLMHVDLN